MTKKSFLLSAAILLAASSEADSKFKLSQPLSLCSSIKIVLYTVFYCTPTFSFYFYADSRGEGVEVSFLSAPRLSDIFFLRLSVGSVVFVSGAYPV